MRLNFLCCDVRTASIVKICPVHLWKYIEIVFCEIFSSEGNCVQKMQVPIFKICVGWCPKKVPKVPVFFGLEGTLRQMQLLHCQVFFFYLFFQLTTETQKVDAKTKIVYCIVHWRLCHVPKLTAVENVNVPNKPSNQWFLNLSSHETPADIKCLRSPHTPSFSRHDLIPKCPRKWLFQSLRPNNWGHIINCTFVLSLLTTRVILLLFYVDESYTRYQKRNSYCSRILWNMTCFLCAVRLCISRGGWLEDLPVNLLLLISDFLRYWIKMSHCLSVALREVTRVSERAYMKIFIQLYNFSRAHCSSTCKK